MKKIFTFILTLCIIFSLVACGNKSEVKVEPIETENIAYAVTETIAYEDTEPATEETIGFIPSLETTAPNEETSPSEEPEKVIDPTVYVTKSGKKYHTASCRWGDIPMLLSEAIAAGYDSCDKCF